MKNSDIDRLNIEKPTTCNGDKSFDETTSVFKYQNDISLNH